MAEKPQQQSATTRPLAGFDPFRDRLSRDIRNDLSRCFGQSLADGSLSPVEELSASLLKRDLQRCYREYAESRLERYRRAFKRIQKSGQDPIMQGLILWDLRLFFEMHDVLEHAWHHSEGDLKVQLQSLIRAAGVYIKLEHGYHRQAAKLAEKACAVLEKRSDALRDYFAPEELIAALRSLNPVPPILLGKSLPEVDPAQGESEHVR
jgi:hypothetical protein